ncbi:conserved hypothetical protein [Xylella fastidiosa M12]|nr:conserved hypothetical protein [Xylella fastidiosa M12]
MPPLSYVEVSMPDEIPQGSTFMWAMRTQYVRCPGASSVFEWRCRYRCDWQESFSMM